MQLEEDVSLQCPFCFETFPIRIDRTAGRVQDFVYDCEVCCQPIAVSVREDSDSDLIVETGRES